MLLHYNHYCIVDSICSYIIVLNCICSCIAILLTLPFFYITNVLSLQLFLHCLFFCSMEFLFFLQIVLFLIIVCVFFLGRFFNCDCKHTNIVCVIVSYRDVYLFFFWVLFVLLCALILMFDCFVCIIWSSFSICISMVQVFCVVTTMNIVLQNIFSLLFL
jgi:hypothetical protein